MFTFQATVKCDHYDCKKTTNIEVEMTLDDRGLPTFEFPYVEGWAISMQKENAFGSPPCQCPEHKSK